MDFSPQHSTTVLCAVINHDICGDALPQPQESHTDRFLQQIMELCLVFCLIAVLAFSLGGKICCFHIFPLQPLQLLCYKGEGCAGERSKENKGWKVISIMAELGPALCVWREARCGAWGAAGKGLGVL